MTPVQYDLTYLAVMSVVVFLFPLIMSGAHRIFRLKAETAVMTTFILLGWSFLSAAVFSFLGSYFLEAIGSIIIAGALFWEAGQAARRRDVEAILKGNEPTEQ